MSASNADHDEHDVDGPHRWSPAATTIEGADPLDVAEPSRSRGSRPMRNRRRSRQRDGRLRSPARSIAVVAAAIVGIGGCGDESGSGDAGASPSTSDGSTGVTASLEIRYENSDADVAFTYGIECGTASQVTGDAAEAGVAATEACDLLSDPVVQERLIDGPPGDRVCTEVYGGADMVAIDGTLDGSSVSTSVDRTDGCGISEWDELLTPLLPPAIGVPVEDGD